MIISIESLNMKYHFLTCIINQVNTTESRLIYTVKVHFSAREKIMQTGQNGPFEKFTRFLFMCLNVACITNIWCDNNMRYKFMRLQLGSHNWHKYNSHRKMLLYGNTIRVFAHAWITNFEDSCRPHPTPEYEVPVIQKCVNAMLQSTSVSRKD